MSARLAMLPLADGGAVDSAAAGKGRGGAEGTWYNPNLMQMAETLGTVMMTGGATEGLPVAYNSCVLALIEGFYRLTRELRATEKELAELKISREMELEQFRGMTEEWVEKSEAYRAEIKRLELLLAKESKDGVACVALARQGSLVDRAGSKRFQANLKRISNSEEQDVVKEKGCARSGVEPVGGPAQATTSYKTPGDTPRILDTQNDILVSRILEEREMQEQRARQRLGRPRAAPVLIRLQGDQEPRNVRKEDVVRGQERRGSTTNTVAHEEAEGMDPSRHGVAPPDDTRQRRPQLRVTTNLGLSTDNESTSSESDSSPQMLPAGVGFGAQSTHIDKEKDGASRAEEGRFPLLATNEVTYQDPRMPVVQEQGYERVQYFSATILSPQPPAESRAGPPQATVAQVPAALKELGDRKARTKHKRPSFLKGGTLSLHQPSRKQHRRGYSFEKGDDEVLSVAPSPTWEPESYITGAKSPSEEGTGEADQYQAVMPGSAQGAVTQQSTTDMSTTAASFTSPGSGSVTHSTSTGTIKWVGNGNEDGNVDGGNAKAGDITDCYPGHNDV
ncbi:uncharacterized protein THITE_2106835 [Thermothielavioides terrestris NRRL 8126]|uniref:Uncharacterized protein n=1 Tax=Thermothielavioides terrestris (strain ATCC 38088 / NRRL 8126) TaxID=578455 RepID=G2QRJ5_THETT|nr:uncharacterized protein THITE_2106835 [Thermothielavioides terrestris NRRL 8126]AEO62540.1 hypothetical protein THITE_2106835 [Thermothielavioides terrestris NRRL 8126]